MNLVGKFGEQAAADYLRRQNYKILSQNYRTRFGEIDIVFLDKDTIVFCEVKTRKSLHAGLPYEAVNFHKKQQIKKTILNYITHYKLLKRKFRFDVISIYQNNNQFEVEHFKNVEMNILI